MPNFVIVGFDKPTAEKIRENIDRLMGFHRTADGITTIISAETSDCTNHVPAPYVIVRDDNMIEARKFGTIISERFNLDVEIQRIDIFLSAPKMGGPKLS